MKVIGYGDNVVDRYVNQNMMYPGGNCINFAAYARRMGIEAAYLGYFGEDAEAQLLKDSIKDMGVDISHCKEEKGSVTERCDIDLIKGERVFREYDERENLHAAYPLKSSDLLYLDKFDLIHVSCYAEEDTEIRKLKDVHGLVSFDFSEEAEYRSEEYLVQICPYIDFALFSCEQNSMEEVRTLLECVAEKGVSYVLATQGAKGQILYDGEKFHTGRVHLIEAVDTMGAGDSFFTSFLVKMLEHGWKKGEKVSSVGIEDAFLFASEFSAQNCLLQGAFGYGKPIEWKE